MSRKTINCDYLPILERRDRENARKAAKAEGQVFDALHAVAVGMGAAIGTVLSLGGLYVIICFVLSL